MRLIALLLALSILTSCAGLQQHVFIPTDVKEARCVDLERKYRFWGGIAAATAAFAGTSAVSVAVPEDEKLRIGVGLLSAGAIAFGAAALFIRDDVLSSYGKECEDLGTVGTSTAS